MIFLTKQQKAKQSDDLLAFTRKESQWKDIFARLIRNRLGIVGLVIVAMLVILVLFAPLFTKYNYSAQDFGSRFVYPNAQHIMGTDEFGRDLWARLLYGGRISLLVAVLAVCIGSSIGAFLGAVAGYFGGIIDSVITRSLDVVMAIPSLLLAIAVSAALGSGPVNTALAISIGGIPGGARLIRSSIMSIRENEFVEAARISGSSDLRIIFVHILPNTIAPLIVSATLGIGGNIMAISSLSFIGLGVQPPIPEWGSILSTGRAYIRDFWPLVTFPSLFIALTLFGFNLFGDALRDSLDPRLKD